MSTSPQANSIPRLLEPQSSVAMATCAVSLPPPRRSSSSSALSESPSGAATPWTYTTVVEPAPTTSHTPRTDPKELPLPPPVLQPLRKHETTGRAPPPRRRPDPPPQGLGWLVVLPGLIVALLSAGLATSLFLYLAVRRDGDAPAFVPHGFYVAEMTAGAEVSPLFGLLASTVITNIVWLLGFPVLISMAAYCIAGSWLSYQQRPRSDRPNLLTPLQYALLFKLLSAPGPASTYQVGTYIARRRPRVPAPAFFTHGFALVAAVLGLTYLISLADLWLHATSTVALLLPPSVPASAHGPDPDSDFPHQAFAGGSPPHPAAPRLRGHYPVAPALAYLVLLYAHALLAAALTLRVACLRSPALSLGPAPSSSYPRDAEAGAAGQRRDEHATSTTSTTATYPAPRPPTVLRLAQLHLTDGLAPVAARLSSRRTPPVHPHHTPYSLFVEDLNTARVEVGVWAPSESPSHSHSSHGRKAEGKDGGRRKSRWGSTSGEGVFGVYKKVVASRGEIY